LVGDSHYGDIPYRVVLEHHVFDLSGRAALVTGGGRGIGRHISIGLAEAGAHVFLASRKIDTCREVALAIEAEGGRATALQADVSKIEEIVAKLGAQRNETPKPMGPIPSSASMTFDSSFTQERFEAAVERCKEYIRAGDIGDVKAVTEFGDVDVRLPMNRAGRLVADTDFGSVDAHLEGMTMRLFRWRSHHFDAQLSGSDTPLIDLATEFGNVGIRVYKVE
ncbi:MAG: SDR family NAD(P)-dependent oxidoreductase, partial [Planctomycetes bacterium]|nr:SDR family NAD(P)-dependent oxidoreductase [Planctomycetota bacterium]